MTITHKISIDLLRQDPATRIDVVQNDTARTLALMLHTGGIPWIIPGSTTAQVCYCKSDGIGGTYDLLPNGDRAWRIADNVLTIALAPQVLTTAGETVLSVLLVSGEATIRTFNITLQVQPDLGAVGCASETYVHCTHGDDALKEIGAKIIDGTIRSIILLGDSITDGFGGGRYNGSESMQLSTNTRGYCWANVFKAFANLRYGTKVRNAGIYHSDMTTQKDAALELVTKDDFVIWLTGTYDRDQPDEYERTLRSNLAAVREKCAGLLVISSLPALRADEALHNATMQTIDELVSKAASGYVPHFSMYQEFFLFCELRNIALSECFEDDVHPNDLGYFIMFRILCTKLGLPVDPYTDYQYGGQWWEDLVNP